MMDKPNKPHPDFPLTPRANGQWAKRVNGKLHTFGSWKEDRDGQKALARWLDEKDDILAGRTPRKKQTGGLTVRDLCNHFLGHKDNLRRNGEIGDTTFNRYLYSCTVLVDNLGRDTIVANLAAEDFNKLRVMMADKWGPTALGTEIQTVRSVLKYGWEANLLKEQVRVGPGFRKPSATVVRRVKAEKGPQTFQPEQISAILEVASANIKAMVLLGINGGLGNTDVACVTVPMVGREWLDYMRYKTAIDRRIPLWPETSQALQAALEARPETDSEYLFIGSRGSDYIGGRKGDRVNKSFQRTCKAAGVTGRTFYDLRRTFQTIGEDNGDTVAVKHIMGHAPATGDMSAVYRQRISDERLLAVTNLVRDWLYPAPPETALKVVG